jgi:hypothetical protein
MSPILSGLNTSIPHHPTPLVLKCIGRLSPFRYFTPFEMVMGDPLPVENLLVLGAIAITGFTLAYSIISHRDISR